MSLDHLCEEGPANKEDIEIPFHIIFSFSTFLIFVYQMGRLCGGAHEISGIKAPLFLHWWVGVGHGGMGGWWWWGVWCAGEGCFGWWTKGG